MKYTKIRILTAAMLTTFLVSSSAPYVYATEGQETTEETQQQQTGTSLIAVSSPNLKVGDTLKVTIRGSISTTMNLKFNPDILKYKTSEQSVSLSGNVVTYSGKEAVISFEALAEGSSGLILSGDGLSGCSTIVQVTEPVTAETEKEEKEEEKAKEEEKKTEKTDEESSEKDTSKEEQEGEEAPESSNTFGTAKRYISIMEPSSVPSDVLESTELETDKGTVVSAYQLKGGSNEFYYLFGMDEKENLGWFIYDATEKTISRVDATIFSSVEVQEEEKPSSGSTKRPKIMILGKDLDEILADRRLWAVLIFVSAVLLVVIINVLFRRRGDMEDQAEEQERNVSQVRDNGDAVAEQERVIPEDFVSKKGDVWDKEEEASDTKYNLTNEDKGEIKLPDKHDIIGEKRVDIMDLNDF